ncbi:Uncharacterized protein PECH_003281 [Penicillium ucsense]|uniref:SPRY domain-containing protein n=1 Tax=Penicillium ucsense TaxID=2839758 RepID=A0A8J8VW32_9EURO|nr:Uncharacterized protein PECM_002934 [Penicillium ucsense]KAF7729606.1 Uncharacterized protein PECH_003281 [Penicillium ucsense]
MAQPPGYHHTNPFTNDDQNIPPPSYDAATSSAPRGPPASTTIPPQSFQHSASAPSDPPPYHNWQEAVPDTSIFPPPPISGYYSSGTGNASSDDAQRAHEFCDHTPLWLPVVPSNPVYQAVAQHDLRPVQQREYVGQLTPTAPGYWFGRTADRNGDCCVLTHLPLYFAAQDSPFLTEKAKTIYFEIKLLALRAGPGGDASGLSLGFAAQPYPSWRSPGWERGSLGVFSDDGCRFVNDSWGGRDFTAPFRVGETLGIGMTLSLPKDPLAMADAMFGTKRKCVVEVFFTRDGRPAGGWNLHEEVDADAGGVEGLEGDFDLYGAIGFFGGVDFQACFDPAGWRWRPTE